MAGGDAVELALQQLHTAFAAGAIAGAGRIDGHIGSSGQLQQIITGIAFYNDGTTAFNLEGYFH